MAGRQRMSGATSGRPEAGEYGDPQHAFAGARLRPWPWSVVDSSRRCVRWSSGQRDLRSESSPSPAAAACATRHDPATDLHLHRIVQESLNNVVRHADAQRVSVSIAMKDSQRAEDRRRRQGRRSAGADGRRAGLEDHGLPCADDRRAAQGDAAARRRDDDRLDLPEPGARRAQSHVSAPGTGQPDGSVAERDSCRRVLLVDDHPIVLKGLRAADRERG